MGKFNSRRLTRRYTYPLKGKTEMKDSAQMPKYHELMNPLLQALHELYNAWGRP